MNCYMNFIALPLLPSEQLLKHQLDPGIYGKKSWVQPWPRCELIDKRKEKLKEKNLE